MNDRVSHARAAVEPRDLISLKDAAVLLQTSEDTLWHWIREGKLPAYRHGTERVFVLKDTVLAMMKPQRPDDFPEELWNRLNVVHISKTPPGVDPAARAFKRLQEHIRRFGPPQGPEAWEDINEARDERSREMDERADAGRTE